MGLVSPANWHRLVPKETDFPDAYFSSIGIRGEFRFLNNFYEAEFDWDFWPCWTSAEAAFQSAKCRTREERERFTRLMPAEAKRLGRRVDLRSDWEQVKDGIMESIVREKFFQIEPLARKLKATGNAELIEGNTWGDTYWGVDLHTMQGQNKLGKILMKVRGLLPDEEGYRY